MVTDVTEEPPAPILRAQDVHKNQNMASKSNVLEKIVSSSKVMENKTQKNVHAKENQIQSKQRPSDESSKQSPWTGNETASNHKSKFCYCVVKCLHRMIYNCLTSCSFNRTVKYIVVIQIMTLFSLVDSGIQRNIPLPSSGFNTYTRKH
jgi:hypothetical protein